jgi:hydroxypyruvate isomerase
MTPLKQSVCWWCYEQTGLDPAALLTHIKSTGYDAVELIPDALFPLAKQHGLLIATIQGHMPLEDGLNKRSNAARLEQTITERIQLAVDWGIPTLIVFSGNRDGLDDATGAQVTAANLRLVARAAEQAKITLVLELLNSKVDHPDYQCDHTAWGIEVVDRVGSPNVKLLYDIYHMQIMEGDVIRTIQDHYAYFGHYHTAGNPGRNDLDDQQELYYPAIVRAIMATGYQGYLGQEFIPKGDPIAALKQGFEVCHITD